MIHIKEVAKQTKITVRTLRYYDQIGLLTASSKTEGGHRLYSEEDLKKLQQIQFLKGMGYSLQDITDMLSDPKWNWTISLKNQLVYIMEEQERLKSIESSLRELINSIAVEGGDDHLAIQKLIRLSLNHKSRLKTFRESMFTDKEIELWTKLPKMSGEDPDSLEWIALIGQIKRLMNNEPASPRVQNIIRRMLEKQLGADDYVTKPFSPMELLARVQAQFRRQRPESFHRSEIIRLNNLALDVDNLVLHNAGKRHELTPFECELLQLFMKNPDRVLTKRDIYQHIWKHENYDGNNLSVFISRLRALLEVTPDSPPHIHAVRGIGYRFSGDGR